MLLYRIKNWIKSFFAKFKKTKFKVVYDSDLPKLLGSLGILEQLQKGVLHCAHCEAVITLDNLGLIFRKGGKIYFVCSNQNCLAKI